ncbi:MAG: hypothetical protein JST11_16865 [Acidobacteria bacterium]|nr:hypothetical protein [Acidobacteriota bacterium]
MEKPSASIRVVLCLVLVAAAVGTRSRSPADEADVPRIFEAGVVNAASLKPELAGATWMTVFGTGLARASRSWVASDFTGNRLPLSLEGVSILVNGKNGYLSYVSPTQINFLAPDDGTTGAIQLQVLSPDGTSEASVVEKKAISPALFAWTAQQRQYVAAVLADGARIGDPGLFRDSTMRAALPGDRLLLFGTGFGPTVPARDSSEIPVPAPLKAPVTVRIGGTVAEVSYAGLVLPGTYQFNVVVPDLPGGDHAVEVETGGVLSQPLVLLTVEGSTAQPAGAIIADHTTTDLASIPEARLRDARQSVRMYYGHTSHGSQITNGMRRLEAQFGAPYKVGIGEQLPAVPDAVNILDASTYDWDPDFHGTVVRILAANPGINVVMYMWCGQPATANWQSILNGYLADMQALEKKYPKITFVYATGNAQDKDCPGAARQKFNEQLRQFVKQNRKVLFDFGDLDVWYDGGVCTYATPSWCAQYQLTPGALIPYEHPQWGGGDYSNPCGHTTWASCDNKAKAMWWLLARIAGWDGVARR